MTDKQTYSLETPYGVTEDNRKTLSVHTADSRPSWKRYGEGSANIKIDVCGVHPDKPASGWMQIIASETAFAGDEGKRDVTKEVFVSLELPALRELRDILNSVDLGDA